MNLLQEIFKPLSSISEDCDEPVHITSTSILTIPIIKNPAVFPNPTTTTVIDEQSVETVYADEPLVEAVYADEPPAATVSVDEKPAETVSVDEESPEIVYADEEEPTKTVVEPSETQVEYKSSSTTEVEIVYVEANQPTSFTAVSKVLSSEVDFNSMA